VFGKWKTMRVTIISKRKFVPNKSANSGLVSTRLPIIVKIPTIYSIIAEFEDGGRREFDICQTIWDRVFEGQKGKLTFKGCEAKDFVREN
jgi:hypothetical protein